MKTLVFTGFSLGDLVINFPVGMYRARFHHEDTTACARSTPVERAQLLAALSLGLRG